MASNGAYAIDPTTKKPIYNNDPQYREWEAKCPVESDGRLSDYEEYFLDDLIAYTLSMADDVNRLRIDKIITPSNVKSKRITGEKQDKDTKFTNCADPLQRREINDVATKMTIEVLMSTAEARLLLIKTTIVLYTSLLKHLKKADPRYDFHIIFKGGNIFRFILKRMWAQYEHNVRYALENHKLFCDLFNMSDLDFQIVYAGSEDSDAVRKLQHNINLITFMAMLRLKEHILHHAHDFFPQWSQLENDRRTVNKVLEPDENGETKIVATKRSGTESNTTTTPKIAPKKKEHSLDFDRRILEMRQRSSHDLHTYTDCERYFQQYFQSITDPDHHYYNATILFVGLDNPYPSIFRTRSSKLKRSDFVLPYSADQEAFYIANTVALKQTLFAGHEGLEDSIDSAYEKKTMYASHNASVDIENELDNQSFQLNRIKLNLVVCYCNKHGEYLCDAVLSEVIDLSHNYADDKSSRFHKFAHGNFYKSTQKYVINTQDPLIATLDGSQKVCFYSYTIHSFMDDLKTVLFIDSQWQPWTDKKYMKRLKRWVWCGVIDILSYSSTVIAKDKIVSFVKFTKDFVKPPGETNALFETLQLFQKNTRPCPEYDEFRKNLTALAETISWSLVVNAKTTPAFDTGDSISVSVMRKNKD